jgi:hypothetical protein
MVLVSVTNYSDSHRRRFGCIEMLALVTPHLVALDLI